MLRSDNTKRKIIKDALSIRVATEANDRTDAAVCEDGSCPVWMKKRFYVLIPLIPMFVSIFAVHCFAYQQKDAEEKTPPPAMTEEEKEMMNDREMLENLALLKDLEQIAFLDLLNEIDPEWSEKDESVLPEEEPVGKEEEGDKK
jgi:hypothetical protein